MPTIGKARDNIRLRSAPSFEAPEIGFIYVTKEVEVVGVEGDWLRVVWEEKEGYVARKFILVADQDALATMAANPTPPSQVAEEKAAKAAAAKPKRPAKPVKKKASADEE